ncbi:hypothetical protein [Clostridium butyricum]|uniref:hypothetical protein n=1 Tax=Clostridium butyricum TaxID=1492 RepID=UPI002ABD1BB7|nr:hypothetical protein [Clostridium butyricum]
MKNKFIITLILLTSVTVPYQKAFAISTSSNTVSVLASVDDKHPISNGSEKGYPNAIWYTNSDSLKDVKISNWNTGYPDKGELDYGKVTRTEHHQSNGGYTQSNYVISAVRGKTKYLNIKIIFPNINSKDGSLKKGLPDGGTGYVVLGTSTRDAEYIDCSFDMNYMPDQFTIVDGKATDTYIVAWIEGESLEDYLIQVKGNIANINQTNGLSQTDILNTLKSGIDNSLANVSIENYSYKPSTDVAAGYYKGTVRVTRLSDNTSDTFNLNVTIPQIPQSIDSVYNSYNKIIPSLKEQ